MDTLTPVQRKKCMAAVRGEHTRPEIAVRRMVHALGYRFRLHQQNLPGSPDIVLPRHRKVIEVRGCFWHLHHCKKGRIAPKSNIQYWQLKRLRNQERDRRNARALRMQGWRLLVVWECQLSDCDSVLNRIRDFLRDSTRR